MARPDEKARALGDDVAAGTLMHEALEVGELGVGDRVDRIGFQELQAELLAVVPDDLDLVHGPSRHVDEDEARGDHRRATHADARARIGEVADRAFKIAGATEMDPAATPDHAP